MSGLRQRALAVQGLAASLAAVAAIGALIAVAVQVQQSGREARTQAARAAWQAHLALAVSSPGYAVPEDTCLLLNSSEGGSYAAFVGHLLSAAEQMLEVDAGWEDTLARALSPHAALLCRDDPVPRGGPALRSLLQQFRQAACADTPSCLPPA